MIPNFIFFSFTLMVCFIVVRFLPRVNASFSQFGLYLTQRAFPSQCAWEQQKFAFVRIFFGLIILVRSSYIIYLLLPSEYFSAVGYWAFSEFVAALFLCFGFSAQWALLFLMLFMWRIGDVELAKSTLGNCVGAMVSLLLFLTNSGRFFSLDGWLIKRNENLSWLLLYQKKYLSGGQIALAKFAALICYWAICVYSLSMHINEPAWMSGAAGPLILSNNFMSNYFSPFTELFVGSPLAVYISSKLIWLQMLWYPLILPLVLLGGIWRIYIIIWGILFFILSLTVLKLGYLAEIEFAFWAGLFWVNFSRLRIKSFNFNAFMDKLFLSQSAVPVKEIAFDKRAFLTAAQFTNGVVLHVCFLTLCYLVSIPMPYVGINTKQTLASETAIYYGITPINVFNRPDLGMTENWFTLHSDEFSELLPVFTNKGARLFMHKSDRLYFGYTLRFRRGVISSTDCKFEGWQDKVDYLSKVYLHLKGVKYGTYHFIYRQLHQSMPEWSDLLGSKYVENEILTRCEISFAVNYQG